MAKLGYVVVECGCWREKWRKPEVKQSSRMCGENLLYAWPRYLGYATSLIRDISQIWWNSDEKWWCEKICTALYSATFDREHE